MKKISMKDIPIKDILEYQKKWWENKDLPFCYEALPYPPKVIYKKMEKLADEGYLDYGVSLRTAWLSDKGEKYLKSYE